MRNRSIGQIDHQRSAPTTRSWAKLRFNCAFSVASRNRFSAGRTKCPSANVFCANGWLRLRKESALVFAKGGHIERPVQALAAACECAHAHLDSALQTPTRCV